MRLAFDELFSAVVEKANGPQISIPRYFDYPVMRMMDSGMPHVSSRTLVGESPKNYSGIYISKGVLSAPVNPIPRELTLIEALQNYLETTEPFSAYTEHYPRYYMSAKILIADSVDKYIHMHGMRKIDTEKRDQILRP